MYVLYFAARMRWQAGRQRMSVSFPRGCVCMYVCTYVYSVDYCAYMCTCID